MGKFAIARRTEAQTRTKSPTAKAVANATPLIHALATKIMSFYTPVEQNQGLSADEQAVQDLFNKWPNDDVSRRLAELTEAITGFIPDISPSTAGLPVGSLFKNSGQIFVTVLNTNNYAYGINAKGTIHNTIASASNINSGSIHHVTIAEAGLFSKELLSTKGVTFLAFASQQLGHQNIPQFLTAIGAEDCI